MGVSDTTEKDWEEHFNQEKNAEMNDIECKRCRVNKYCGTLITCEQTKEVYQQGRADERAKVLDKVLNSEKFFGNYIDARDLIEWLKAHK